MKRLARLRRPVLGGLVLGGLALGGSTLGCDDAGRGAGKAPPAGFPWLADTYTVELELVESACIPGGFEPTILEATADVWQDGTRVEWRQTTPAEDGQFWYLTGAVCAQGDGHVLRIAGGRRDTVDGCQVRTTLPAGGFDAKADPCTAANYLELQFEADGCGGLVPATDTVRARLSYERTCGWRSDCDLVMRWRAVPLDRDDRAPLPPPACP